MVEQILGAVLGILVLIDIFFLVLYPHAQRQASSANGFRACCGACRSGCRGPWDADSGSFLTLAGPIILITVDRDLGTAFDCCLCAYHSPNSRHRCSNAAWGDADGFYYRTVRRRWQS